MVQWLPQRGLQRGSENIWHTNLCCVLTRTRTGARRPKGPVLRYPEKGLRKTPEEDVNFTVRKILLMSSSEGGKGGEEKGD